jgi:hypothetical protein
MDRVGVPIPFFNYTAPSATLVRVYDVKEYAFSKYEAVCLFYVLMATLARKYKRRRSVRALAQRVLPTHVIADVAMIVKSYV